MKKLLAGSLVIACLGLAAAWLRLGAGPQYASAADCADAYYRAVKDADEAAYLGCLGEALRSAYRQRYANAGALAADLRARGRDLRGWVVRGDEARADG